MLLKFLGAVRTVTGSMHYIEVDDVKLLLDAGRFEGSRDFERRWNLDFRFRPDTIDAIIISHAHNDHIGRLPILLSRGYKGKILATNATIDLASLILEDAAEIEEDSTRRENGLLERKRQNPRQPLFTSSDVREVLSRMVSVDYYKETKVVDDVYVTFFDAGHILGSAIIHLRIDSRRGEYHLTYTGDLGRPGMPLIRDPDTITQTDFLIMESTYGDKIHEPLEESIKKLEKLVIWVYRHGERGGKLIIPAFAVGRTQTIIYILHQLYTHGRIPEVPIYVDSPMAIYATEVFKRHKECFYKETWDLLNSPNNPLSFKMINYIDSESESLNIISKPEPAIIIAASGMLTGGRILRHIYHTIDNPYNAILFTGYQANGTLGRKILDGADKITLFGKELEVKAKIEKLDGLSAHADSRDLLNFVLKMKNKPRMVFLVHGDMPAISALAQKLRSSKISYQIPSYARPYRIFDGFRMIM